MPTGGQRTPIQPGLVARAAGAIRGAIAGAREAWFGPGEPLQTIAPPSVHGRTWDYPVAWNIAVTPRGESGENGIGFADLRALADPTLGGLDLLRIAIEKRKDQMEAQRWSIRGRAKPGGKQTDGGTKAREIEIALRSPDGVHTFSQWQRMLVEDLLVIDAPTVYLAPSTKGYRIPQVMDGALLKLLLQEDGRTPLPPDPAFQQVLKGVPASTYTLDELVRLPRNLRSNRAYGMSPVEQVQMTISIALRRQLHQLEYYTEGNVPDMLITAPLDWSPSQIKEIQQWFDTLGGNTADRRKMRLVPGGLAPFPLKDSVLKDAWDDWLARIVCWAFGLSPQALMTQMNRATAQTAKQSAQEEGLEPIKLWWKDFVDQLLLKAFDAPELELAFEDEEIADPEAKANVFATGLGKGGGKAWWTPDEVRAKYGDEPLTAKQKAEMEPAAPAPAGPDAPAADEPAKPVVPAKDKPAKVAKHTNGARFVEFVRDEQGVLVGARVKGD
jgi:hypothetical protein